jgi:cyclohexa-1,5-dienecarbonyl-CoA hydratase
VACAALAALVGQKRAAELILTGRTITGEEAAEIGLATGAVDESDLPEEISKCCSVLTSLSPVALSLAKKAIYAWDSMHFDKGLARAEKIYFEDLMQTADANEGVRAFIEKREPKWTGK